MSLHRAGERPGQSRPLSWRLYLPEAWTADPARRHAAGIPATLTYQSKTDLALAVLDEALGWGAYPGVVLADEAWHHHVALVTTAFAFLRAEQRRRTRNTKKSLPPPTLPAVPGPPHPLEWPMSLVPNLL